MDQDQLIRFIAPLTEEDCDWRGTQCTLYAVLDSLPVGVSIKDAATLRYVFRNRANLRLLGVNIEDSIGRRSCDLFPPDVAESFEASDREALARGGLALADFRIPNAGSDGAELVISETKTVVHDRDGRPRLIVCVFEDVTGPRRAEGSLRMTNAELEQRVRERTEQLDRAGRINQMGEMAAGLAHEINQPLAAIIYTLTGAAKRARDGALNNAQMLDALQAAIAHAHRSAGIVARIRDLANKHTPRHAAVRLNDVATEIIRLSAPTAARQGVRLRLEAAPDLPEVEADEVQIEQVLLNLIRNGIDAVVEESGLRREVTVRTARLDRDTVEVSVEDSGGGADPERLRRIFEPFYTTREGGMGLGLTICQSIIENHGGRLRAANRAEGGLCLSFTLPVRRAGA